MSETKNLNSKPEEVQDNSKYGKYVVNGIEHTFGDKVYAQTMKELGSEGNEVWDDMHRYLLDEGRKPGNKYCYNSQLNIEWVVTKDGKIITNQNMDRNGFQAFTGGLVNSKRNQYNKYLQNLSHNYLWADDPEEVKPTSIGDDTIVIAPIDEQNKFDPYTASALSAAKRIAALKDYMADPEAWEKSYSFSNENWKDYITTLKDKISTDILSGMESAIINGNMDENQWKLANLFGITHSDWIDPSIAVAEKEAADEARIKEEVAKGIEAALRAAAGGNGNNFGNGSGDSNDIPDDISEDNAEEETPPQESVSFRTHYIPGMWEGTLNIDDKYLDTPWIKAKMKDSEYYKSLILTDANNQIYAMIFDKEAKKYHTMPDGSLLIPKETFEKAGWGSLLNYVDELDDVKFWAKSDGLRSLSKNSLENELVAVKLFTKNDGTGGRHTYKLWKNIYNNTYYIEMEGKNKGESIFKEVGSEEAANNLINAESFKDFIKNLSDKHTVKFYNYKEFLKEGGVLKLQEGTTKGGLVENISVSRGDYEEPKKDTKASNVLGATSFGLNSAGAAATIAGFLFKNPTLLKAAQGLYGLSIPTGIVSVATNPDYTAEQKIAYAGETIPSLFVLGNSLRPGGNYAMFPNINTINELKDATKNTRPTLDQQQAFREASFSKYRNSAAELLGLAGTVYGISNAVTGIYDLIDTKGEEWDSRRWGDLSQITSGVTPILTRGIRMIQLNKLNNMVNQKMPEVSTGPLKRSALLKMYNFNDFRNKFANSLTPEKLQLFDLNSRFPKTYDFYMPENPSKWGGSPWTTPYNMGIAPFFGRAVLLNRFKDDEYKPKKDEVLSLPSFTFENDNTFNVYKKGGKIIYAKDGFRGISNQITKILGSDNWTKTTGDFWNAISQIDHPDYQNKVWNGGLNLSSWDAEKQQRFTDYIKSHANRISIGTPNTGKWWETKDLKEDPIVTAEKFKLAQGLFFDYKNSNLEVDNLEKNRSLLHNPSIYFDKLNFDSSPYFRALEDTNRSIDMSTKNYIKNTSDGGRRAAVAVSGFDTKEKNLLNTYAQIGKDRLNYNRFNNNLINQERQYNFNIAASNNKADAETNTGIVNSRIARNTQISQKLNDFFNTGLTWEMSNRLQALEPAKTAYTLALQQKALGNAKPEDVEKAAAEFNEALKGYRYPSLFKTTI